MALRASFVSSLALFAVAVATPACKSSVPQLPQAQTAGMRVDVQKVSYSARKKEVSMRVRIWNDHDARINFDLGDVRLVFNDREVSPTASRTSDRDPDVQAKSPRTFDWVFELGDVMGEGTYPVEIRNLKRGGQPFAEIARFAIVIGA